MQGGRRKRVVLGVHDERAAVLAVAAVAHLSFTRAELARGRDLLDVGVRAEGREECNGLLGLLDRLDKRRG